MNNLNSILIEGNLVRDPLHRTTPKGTSVCTFSLACNRYLKHESGYEQEVSFFDIEAWSKLGDTCYNLGRKGRGVRVIGHLKQDRWVDTEGKPHSRVVIVGEHAEFKPDFKRRASKAAGEDSADEIAAEAGNIIQTAEDDFAPMDGTLPIDAGEYEAAGF